MKGTQPYDGYIHNLTRIEIGQGKSCWIYFTSIAGREAKKQVEWKYSNLKPEDTIENIRNTIILLPEKIITFVTAFPHITRFIGWTIENKKLETNDYEFARYVTPQWDRIEIPTKNNPLNFLTCSLERKILCYEGKRWDNAQTVQEYFSAQRNIQDIGRATIRNSNKLLEFCNQNDEIIISQ